MKQKRFVKIVFSGWLALALLFPMGAFFNSPLAAATTKKTTEKNYVESEVVAKFSNDANPDALGAKYNLDISLLKTAPDGNLYVLKSQHGLSTKKIIKLLQNDPEVISVQPNFKYLTLARVPNDPYFSQEWPLAETAGTPGGLNAPSAWDFDAKKKNKVPIAIIDSGVSYVQPDLKDSLTGGSAKGRNINNPKKKPQDTEGHGTFLAGIIAAQTNNRKGLAGASFFNNLKIMPLKFDFTTDQAVTAINYAKVRHIPVVNASWGAYGNDGLDLVLKDTIAAYPGTFVAAAGNGDPDTFIGFNHDSGNLNDRMYPCDFDLANILCVGASDKNGNITDYSDYGAASVDVVAPGGTDTDPIIGLDLKKNKYTAAEGSSLSAAYATAEAGLILSKKPSLSSAQVIEIIKNSVDPEPSLAGKILTGGKINFQRALQLAATY